ncbi:calcium:proton antiporter [Methylotenera versatilis]|uniref:calcium:proton antiporter n=1 Tax=Methylotenera versatilis TaxID=1055487 RepID=UPI000648E3E6|nr:ionic transporter y4hA [Methylotenera versatilis]
MSNGLKISTWSIVAPILAGLVLAASQLNLNLGGIESIVMAIALIGAVLSAVHHAETIAHKVGEPYGTLLLATAITVIEVGLILSLMLTGGPETAALARDTVFAAVMIIITGIVGICSLIGGLLYKEQVFKLHGANASLSTLAAIVVLTLILPNYTLTTRGPVYSASQLAFIALVSLVLYGTFVFVQAIRHRNYFLDAKDNNDDEDGDEDKSHNTNKASNSTAYLSTGLLLLCLVAVVLLAKSLAPTIESFVKLIHAPRQLVGVIIASIVLLPEGLAAVRAARKNMFQTSLNLALGSALASIGLTIPAVAILSLMTGWTLFLGIDMKSTVLVLLALFVNAISLATGRTNVLQGVILLVIFGVYLFTTAIP